MVVETESTKKNQPHDIKHVKSDLFKKLHQWAYLNYKLLSDIFTIIRVQNRHYFSLRCQIYTFVLPET
jgi:hypothetical protein